MQLSKDQKAALAWSAMALAGAVAVWLLGPVLTPFLVAAVLAYALAPLVRRIDHLWGKRIPRVATVLLVETVFLLAVLAIMLLIVPIMAKEIPLLREQLPVLADRINETVPPILHSLGFHVVLDMASVKAFVLKYLSANMDDAASALLSSLKLGGSVALALIGNAILIPVALFYLLLDWHRLVPRVMHCCHRDFAKPMTALYRRPIRCSGSI